MLENEIRAEIDRIGQRKCECVYCSGCGGTGHIRVDMFTGLPEQGMDDLYDLAECPECDNSCLVEVCDRCREMEELGQQLEEMENRLS